MASKLGELVRPQQSEQSIQAFRLPTDIVVSTPEGNQILVTEDGWRVVRSYGNSSRRELARGQWKAQDGATIYQSRERIRRSDGSVTNGEWYRMEKRIIGIGEELFEETEEWDNRFGDEPAISIRKIA